MSWYDKFKTKDTKSKSSSFWYDDYDTSYDYMERFSGYGQKDLDAFKKTHNVYKLASVRRAIGNFVQIVTNKSIPVTFATKSDSKTDGKKVILSADVDDDFDVSVGLALHEGSHIVLSDFEMLSAIANMRTTYDTCIRTMEYEISKSQQDPTFVIQWNKQSVEKRMMDAIKQYPKYETLCNEIWSSNGKIGSKGMVTNEVLDLIQGLTNWIEDRRIDHYIYHSAPGYKDYYVSMYEHYFNDKSVTKGVQSDEFTEETFESYMFRIINLLNENTDLSKLKGLRAIYRKLDLKNISRLKTTNDSFELSIDILDEILRYVPIDDKSYQNQKAKGSGDGEGGEIDLDEIVDGDGTDAPQMGGGNGDMSGKVKATLSEGDDSNQSGNTKVKLSANALDQLRKKFQKQKDFLNGDTKKKKLTNQENDKVNDIQESGTDLVRVGSDVERQDGTRIGKGVDCVVVKKLTNRIMESQDFPFTGRSWKNPGLATPYTTEVSKGKVLGNILGKKLQIRSESRETISSRLKKGKIDGRMVASLGYDNENVFYTTEVDNFKKANLHISIDYSGSMSGDKIRRCVTSTVAIVRACEMARNINVQVSIRSTDNGHSGLPYIVMVHDSRRDTFRQFCDYMSKLTCSNTTPEGLCFEAIIKQLIPSTNDTDSYFLNFSDGQPTYSISKGGDEIHYSGKAAADHTRRQVKKMIGNGINVLSYFITESSSDRFESSSDWSTFKQCYGNDAKYVNVENMFAVAKSMNELFLKKA